MELSRAAERAEHQAFGGPSTSINTLASSRPDLSQDLVSPTSIMSLHLGNQVQHLFVNADGTK